MGCHPVAVVIMHVHKYEIEMTKIWMNVILKVKDVWTYEVREISD
jgi:hypothetical protein